MLARLSRDVDAIDAALPSMLAQVTLTLTLTPNPNPNPNPYPNFSVQTFSCIAALLATLLAIVLASPLVLPAVLLVGLAFGRVVCDYQVCWLGVG